MLIALFAATVMVQDIDPSGRYGVEGAPGSCALRLQASLPGLPEALVEGEAQSGFAFATPGCPVGLEALALWRFVTDTQTLTLVDGAGETLLSARLDGQDWLATTDSGATVRLTRD